MATSLSPNLSSEQATIDDRDIDIGFNTIREHESDGNEEDELIKGTRHNDPTKCSTFDGMHNENILDSCCCFDDENEIYAKCTDNHSEWVTKDWDDEPQSPNQAHEKHMHMPRPCIGYGITPDEDFLDDWDDQWSE
uniref:Uncharacterized protein n=3 Tax=Leptocylindrus danicus TaxID=163516 RepID=A0A7S2K4Q7_9STRA|mmetsp:Transcript_17694/g.26360  ORF Transcript_17694/g.26360 Transcript_17694/m.26360 type:complete len:136 (+) Transcript_17694:16-423(+)